MKVGVGGRYGPIMDNPIIQEIVFQKWDVHENGLAAPAWLVQNQTMTIVIMGYSLQGSGTVLLDSYPLLYKARTLSKNNENVGWVFI